MPTHSAPEPTDFETDRSPERPFLSPQEREAINRGRWFAALTPSLRHDIFRLGRVTRYTHGQLIVEQGQLAQDWFSCASGAIRFRRTTPSGKQVTLAYVEPGIWVGEAEVLHRGPNTYDAHAHGPTTVLSVAEAVFRQLLRQHPEFGEALLTLQARRMRYLYWMMEDMATSLTDSAASGVTDFLMTVAAFLILVMASKILLYILIALFSKRNNPGATGIIDGLLGLGVGFIKGFVVVYLVLAIMIPAVNLASPDHAFSLLTSLDSSLMAKDLYDNNPLLLLFRS